MNNKVGFLIVVLVLLGMGYVMLKIRQRNRVENLELIIEHFNLKMTDTVNKAVCVSQNDFEALEKTYVDLKTQYDEIATSVFITQDLKERVRLQLVDLSDTLNKLRSLPTCQTLCNEATYDPLQNNCNCPTGMWGVTGMNADGMNVVYCQAQNCDPVQNSFYNRETKVCECKAGYIFNGDKSGCYTCEELLPNSTLDTNSNSCKCNPGFVFKDGKCLPCDVYRPNSSYDATLDQCVCNVGYTGTDTCDSITEIHDKKLSGIMSSLDTISNRLDSFAKTNPADNGIPSNSLYKPSGGPTGPGSEAYDYTTYVYGGYTGYTGTMNPSTFDGFDNVYYLDSCREDTFTDNTNLIQQNVQDVKECADLAIKERSRYFKLTTDRGGNLVCRTAGKSSQYNSGKLSKGCKQVNGLTYGADDKNAAIYKVNMYAYNLDKNDTCDLDWFKTNYPIVGTGYGNLVISQLITMWILGSNGSSVFNKPGKLFMKLNLSVPLQSQPSVGKNHIIITMRGQIMGIGRNDKGQLGQDPSKVSVSLEPVTIVERQDNTFKKISCGEDFTIGIKLDGTMWGWGANEVYQLGQGTNSPYEAKMVQIGPDLIWSEVSCGPSYTIATTSDGKLYGWGTVAGETAKTPSTMSVVDTALRVSAGVNIMYVEGKPSTWVPVPLSSSVQAPDLSGLYFSTITPGNNHTVAMTSGRKIYGWGNNTYYQLAISDYTSNVNRAIELSPDTDWMYVYPGDTYTIATKNDGSIWVVGTIVDGIGNVIFKNITFTRFESDELQSICITEATKRR